MFLQSIERRKGGGGGGKTSTSGGSSGSSASSSTGGSGTTSSGGKSTSSGGKVTSVPLSGSTSTGKSTATAYGSGQQEGGTRGQVFGTRTYGSGYPGITGRGVVGRGFSVLVLACSSTAYLHDTEYGDSMNSSRVGGPMVEATFISNSMNTTFHVLSDNSTATSLVTTIDANCTAYLSSDSTSSLQPFNASAPGAPQPEQAIQYYRSSSIVLTLDGYNNSATLDSDPNATDSPLPSAIDLTLMDCLNQTIAAAAPLIDGAGPRPNAVGCLNQTIAAAAPLIDGAGSRWSTVPSTVPLVGLAWLVWNLLSFV
ncbi:hypothetical protein BU15DRAFT_91157 [Melanogaster broomeanus]|nr:hypothetical protein BU15DRAFT_91157 [Melanogaster broomeanus]